MVRTGEDQKASNPPERDRPDRSAIRLGSCAVAWFYSATLDDQKLARMFCFGSGVSLGLAVLAGGLCYPTTYGQPDFGYGLGVMFTIGFVVLFSFPGLVLTLVGLWFMKRRSILLWALLVAHLMLCIGVPLTFKFGYKSNMPLLSCDSNGPAAVVE